MHISGTRGRWVNPCDADFGWGNVEICFCIYIDFSWDCAGSCSYLTKTCLPCSFNTLVAEVLAVQGVRASAATLLTKISQNISLSPSKGLIHWNIRKILIWKKIFIISILLGYIPWDSVNDNQSLTSVNALCTIGNKILSVSIIRKIAYTLQSQRCSNNIFILDLTPGFIGLGKDICKTRQETFKFGDLMCLILEIFW